MRDRETLIREALENPDPGATLILADWLEEHGTGPKDAEWAQVIRLQLSNKGASSYLTQRAALGLVPERLANGLIFALGLPRRLLATQGDLVIAWLEEGGLRPWMPPPPLVSLVDRRAFMGYVVGDVVGATRASWWRLIHDPENPWAIEPCIFEHLIESGSDPRCRTYETEAKAVAALSEACLRMLLTKPYE